ALEPDGLHLASAARDATFRRWRSDLTSAVPSITAGNAMQHDVPFLPDGGAVLAACDDGTVRLCDVRTHDERWRHTGNATAVTAVNSIAINSQAKCAAAADDAGFIRLINLDDG